MMRVMKTGHDAKAQYERMKKMPTAVSPKNVMFSSTDNKKSFSYDWIDGQVLRDPNLAYSYAYAHMWTSNQEVQDINVDEYTSYCRVRACGVGFEPECDVANKILMRSHFTPVEYCHGDMTLVNCLITPARQVFFIDPGFCRGLPCVELDVSKLLQSWDGWDEVRHGLDAPKRMKTPIEKVHWALLITHYIRILKNGSKHPASSCNFACERIREIARWIE